MGLKRNMVELISFFIGFILQYSTEFESEFPTCEISRIERVLEICISRILSSPLDNCSICLSGISLAVFIYSDPDSDIHPMFLDTIESSTSDEFSCRLFENKILECFLIYHISHDFFHKSDLFGIIRQMRSHIEILVCQTELELQFPDINSSIGRKWNKNTSLSFDTRSGEIEMGIREEGHRLLDFKSFKFIILKTSFHSIHVPICIKIISTNILSPSRFFFIECKWNIDSLNLFCNDNSHSLPL